MGFMTQRYLRNRISWTMNLLELVQMREELAIFYFLEGAKAFDRVEWGFLAEILQRMGIGPQFWY